MSVGLVVSYTLFSFFLFYQQLHIKTFHGASQAFLALLSTFALSAMLGGLAFLFWLGYKVSWLTALGLFVIAFAIQSVWFVIESRLALRGLAPYISIAGFVAIPICAFFMWQGLPQ